MYYTELPQPLSAEELTKLGYRRISSKHKTVSRIDRKDWQQFLLDINPNLLLGQDGGASFYRRVYSKDTVEGIPDEIFKGIPGSDFDPVGFVRDDGTPHPGYKIVLVEVEEASGGG